MKKKIKSLVTDDLFEEKTIDPIVNTFGNYRIIGSLELVAVNNYEKVKLSLYFNHMNSSFFLVKMYLSGKYHVDFFNYNTYGLKNLCTLEYLNNQEICRLEEDNNKNGLLFYSNYDNMFLMVNSNGFNMKMRKV
jgi:hypothetical protein